MPKHVIERKLPGTGELRAVSKESNGVVACSSASRGRANQRTKSGSPAFDRQGWVPGRHSRHFPPAIRAVPPHRVASRQPNSGGRDARWVHVAGG